MFDINYYNEKFKENLGSIGGSTPSEGVSNWELWGETNGQGTINLPSDWEEIRIISISTFSNLEGSFSRTLTKQEFNDLFDVYTSGTITDFHTTTKHATWALTTNQLNLQSCVINSTSSLTNFDFRDAIITKVYYKKKSPITVNVGTESNWELWGSATGTNYVSLPSQWEEILFVIQSPNNYVDSTPNLVCTKDQFEIAKNSGQSSFKLNYMLDTSTVIDVLIEVNNNQAKIYNGAKTNTKLHLYYKKKCDNVLDINDMGEWKEWGKVTSGSSLSFIEFPTNYKEVLFVTNDKNVITNTITKSFFENAINNGTSASPTKILMSNESSNAHIQLYKGSNNYKFIYSNNISGIVYYR